MSRPTRWSYSSWSTYKRCPAMWKFSYVDQISWPSSAAMSRGTRMHLMAEEFVSGVIDTVPPEIQKIGVTLFDLKNRGAKSEAVWCLNKSWEPVDKDDPTVWIKAVVDVHYFDGDVLHLSDYKSGQMYDDHRDQLELYGLIGLCTHPHVKRVETSAIYMDTNHVGMQGSILRSMVPAMSKVWHIQAEAMMADEELKPTPSKFACSRCSYHAKYDGPCEAGV